MLVVEDGGAPFALRSPSTGDPRVTTKIPQPLSTHVTDQELANALMALSTAVESGVSLQRLVDDPVVAPTLPRALARGLSGALSRGRTASEGLADSKLLLPHEVALVGAAERSGRLDAGLANVAHGIEQRRADRRKLAASVAYPLFLVVASGVILPLPVIVTEGVAAYLARAIWLPLVFGALVFVFAVWLPRLPATDPRRAIPGRVARSLPFVRGALRRHDVSVFTAVLGQCIASGLGMGEAVAAAAASAQDGSIRRAGDLVRRRIDSGATLAAALQSTGAFPPQVLAMVAQGELSGTLDRVLLRAAAQEAEASRIAMRRILLAVIGVVYTVVVLFIAWRIIAGFAGVLDTLEQAMEIE